MRRRATCRLRLERFFKLFRHLAGVYSALIATKIIVIGAGLAGSACAYALAQRGCEVTLLSQGGGASELPVGLLAAHLSAQDIELSQLSRIGVECTIAHAKKLLCEGLDWQPCTLEQRLLFHPEKNERLQRGAAMIPSWYEARPNSVRHKIAAWIKPQALAQAWVQQSGVKVVNASVSSLRFEQGRWQALNAQDQCMAQAPQIIIASGAQSGELMRSCGHDLLMDNVSGSVAFGAWPDAWNAPQVINGNGHFIGGVASLNNESKFWLSGATYERESYESPAALQIASLQANLTRLQKLLPTPQFQVIRAQFEAEQVQGWQGIRCTTSDRLPIVGKLQEGLHVCTAMGSRGLSFAALCAELLASEITDQPTAATVPADLRKLLQAKRLVVR